METKNEQNDEFIYTIKNISEKLNITEQRCSNKLNSLRNKKENWVNSNRILKLSNGVRKYFYNEDIFNEIKKIISTENQILDLYYTKGVAKEEIVKEFNVSLSYVKSLLSSPTNKKLFFNMEKQEKKKKIILKKIEDIYKRKEGENMDKVEEKHKKSIIKENLTTENKITTTNADIESNIEKVEIKIKLEALLNIFDFTVLTVYIYKDELSYLVSNTNKKELTKDIILNTYKENLLNANVKQIINRNDINAIEIYLK